jgi:hypothetical protein
VLGFTPTLGQSRVATYGVMGVLGNSKIAKQYTLLFDTLVLMMGVL